MSCIVFFIFRITTPQIFVEFWHLNDIMLQFQYHRTLNQYLHCRWIFIGRTEAKAPIFWPPDVKCQLIGKDPDAGKDWGKEGKIEGRRRRGQQMRWLDGITDSSITGWTWETVKDREAWHVAVYTVAKSKTQLRDWPKTTVAILSHHEHQLEKVIFIEYKVRETFIGIQ